MTHTVRYRGPAPFVGLLAQTLREEGVEVNYNPPVEQRGAGEVMQQVVVNLACGGTLIAIQAGVQRFRRRVRKADVEVEEGDDKGS